jgi:ribosome-binding factor A
MESQRQLKISKLLQRELGEIFQREVSAKFIGIMITVTKVNITRDLSLARVYLSLFPTKDKQNMMESIIGHTNEIRFHLGKRIKNQVRQIPELEFFLDDSLDYIENIESILKDK